MAKPDPLGIKIFPSVKMFDRLLEEAINEAVEGPLHEAAKLVRDEAKSLIVDEPPFITKRTDETTPTGGRWVRISKVRVRSTPGGPPFSRSGKLRESIRAVKNFVGTTRLAPYGRFVEFGTRRFAARPFLRPALDRLRPVIAPLLKDMNLRQTEAGRKMKRKKIA